MTTSTDNVLLSSKEMGSFLKAVGAKGLPFKFTAKGMSMSPFICDKDSIVIEPASGNRSFMIGDIVAFIDPTQGCLIVHRIIERHDNLYLLKGDNAFHSDGFCRKQDLHGYVKKIIIPQNNHHFFYQTIRRAFLFSNRFKKTIAFLSRYKLLTPICRISNKIL